MEKEVVLFAKGIDKAFPGVHALKDVDLEVKRGEVCAVLGENGAGKSTLIKILGGILNADKGEIFVENRQVKITNTNSAEKSGISVIHQELCLAPNMTVMENIFLGREKTRGGITRDKLMEAESGDVLKMVGLDIDPATAVSRLSTAQRQMVEIAKVIYKNTKIIIMDEPTSSLTKTEVENLFDIIKTLKKNNVSIVFISHKLDEIFEIADRITVLRDGENVGTREVGSTDNDELVHMMIGRKIDQMYNLPEMVPGKLILKVTNLDTKNFLQDISFELYENEILGLSGLVGSGRTELVRAIFGIDPLKSGTIEMDNKKMNILSPQDAIRAGISLVPEDRKLQGLILMQSVKYNITFAVLSRFLHGIRTNKAVEDKIAGNYIEQLSIKTPSAESRVAGLSGGNQQKVVISKWLATEPKVLILDEPTRGIDIKTKIEIYRLMVELANTGMGIIMISSELPEIVNMSTRVLVMNNGRLTASLKREEISQMNIMQYATGIKGKAT